jgi:hypothetical protein
MKSLFPLLTALALLAAGGLVHGLWTERWHGHLDVELAAERLAACPVDVGDWKGEEIELDRDELRQARVAGYWARRFTRQHSEITVSAILLCGQPGPMAVHTPDVCYSGAGYELTAPPVRCTVDIGAGRPAEAWAGKFRKFEANVPTYLRVFWAWHGSDGWQAADFPRLKFARAGVLYKLYVLRELPSNAERLPDDPCLDFLRQLLPALEPALYPSERE